MKEKGDILQRNISVCKLQALFWELLGKFILKRVQVRLM